MSSRRSMAEGAPMDEYELAGKAKELKELQDKQGQIRVENSMLSEHLTRIVTRKGSLQLHLEQLEEEEAEREQQEPLEAAGGRRRSSRRSFKVFQDGPAGSKASVRFLQPEKPQPKVAAVPMSMEEKVEIAEEECDSLGDTLEKIRAENERVLDDLRAVYREARHSLAQTRKERNSFQREVMLFAEVNPNEKLYTEDVLRYVEDKLRKKRNLRDKLQEKNDLLHMEIMDSEHQFSIKKDLKDILHPIDFDQLTIQNIALRAKIKDRVRDVWAVKGTTKRAARMLEATRKKLTVSVNRGFSTRQSLRDRKWLVDSTVNGIALEKKQHRKLHEAYMTSLQEEDGPTKLRVLDYMRSRICSADLRKQLKTWRNKVEIAELTSVQLLKLLAVPWKQPERVHVVNVRPEVAVSS